MSRLLFLVVLLGFGMAATGQSIDRRTIDRRIAGDELVFMADDEPAMQEAFRKARATLDDFLSKAKSPPPGTVAYAVKIGLREGGKVEYFWLLDVQATGNDSFIGTVDNTPQMISSVVRGQAYEFRKGQIVDWMYVDRRERRIVGNFTMCALLTKESPEAAEATRRRLGLDLRCE